ncbi:MAG: AmmeMemoRadiSam system protein A [Deltaproteobacteria bacterium]|nr:AmmeMemoRadiSam system protein A [Deltaproteobacteria bacterium]
MEFNLTENEKKLLIKIARKSIEDSLSGKKDNYLNSEELAGSLTDNLKKKAGVFVTLKTNGEQLRGCIGNFVSNVPIYTNIYKMAYEAAFNDPRFRPLDSLEINNISIEISVLSPLEKISSFDEIIIGKHGLYIMKGPYHGVLLPQVATEYHMNKTQFLEAVSQKAGLPNDAYKENADIYIFSAEIFSE